MEWLEIDRFDIINDLLVKALDEGFREEEASVLVDVVVEEVCFQN